MNFVFAVAADSAFVFMIPSSQLSTKFPKTGPELIDKELRLFERGEMAAAIHFVPVDEVA